MKRTRRWPAVVVLLLGSVLVGLLYLVPGTASFGNSDTGEPINVTCRALGPGAGGGSFPLLVEDTLGTSGNYRDFVDRRQPDGMSGYDYAQWQQNGVNAACNQVRGNQQAGLTLAVGALVVFVVLARRRLRGDGPRKTAPIDGTTGAAHE